MVGRPSQGPSLSTGRFDLGRVSKEVESMTSDSTEKDGTLPPSTSEKNGDTYPSSLKKTENYNLVLLLATSLIVLLISILIIIATQYSV